jgi:hypothetical protein
MENVNYAPTINLPDILRREHDDMIQFIRSVPTPRPRLPFMARLRLAARVLVLGRQ